MKSRALGRLLTAMVTPFDADGAVDHAKAGLLANRLIAEGCDGVIVSGTTGESPTLSDEEKVALFRSVVKAVNGRGTVIAGTGTNDTHVACALSMAARDAGCDGLLVVNPYYNKPDQAGLHAHFTAVARATDLPVILYNHPGRTGVTIEPTTMVALSQLPNVVGVKDSSGNLDLVTAYRIATGPDFVIWSGDDPLTLPYLAIGAHGVISVSAHVVARELKAMLDAWERGDVTEARRLHELTYPLSKALFCAPSPAPTKHALYRVGINTGGVRLPLVGLDAHAQAIVNEAVWALRPDGALSR